MLQSPVLIILETVQYTDTPIQLTGQIQAEVEHVIEHRSQTAACPFV